MTRDKLFEITDNSQLTCDVERVTTGRSDAEAFREFEFTHPNDSVDKLREAADEIAEEWGLSTRAGFIHVRYADSDGKPYLSVSSFYCGPAAK